MGGLGGGMPQPREASGINQLSILDEVRKGLYPTLIHATKLEHVPCRLRMTKFKSYLCPSLTVMCTKFLKLYELSFSYPKW
jgi:hypothetical protein